MTSPRTSEQPPALTLQPVSRENWRAVAQLTVTPHQAVFVAAPTYYLTLCCYSDTWHPLAIVRNDEVIGFCMWGIDPVDTSCWLGGVLIDQRYQGRGYGKRAVQAALALLAAQPAQHAFALSYHPHNHVAKQLYHSLGFRETGEVVDDEVVARFHYVP
jgi:diamine N-acetyltransferase